MAVDQAFQAVGNIVSGFEAGKQATYAAKVADYNAKVDIANAEQAAMNSVANIQKQRLQGEQYLSSQRASYAASGVLSDTGSAMAVQATTAARLEQNIQQYWAQTQQKEAQGYSQAQLEVMQGKQRAQMYHLAAAADFFKAAGNIANAVAGSSSTSGGDGQSSGGLDTGDVKE
jgi:hypothetical protein